mgnify:CR=1 FL=1
MLQTLLNPATRLVNSNQCFQSHSEGKNIYDMCCHFEVNFYEIDSEIVTKLAKGLLYNISLTGFKHVLSYDVTCFQRNITSADIFILDL